MTLSEPPFPLLKCRAQLNSRVRLKFASRFPWVTLPNDFFASVSSANQSYSSWALRNFLLPHPWGEEGESD